MGLLRDAVCVVAYHAEHHAVAEHAGLAEHATRGDAAERSDLIARELGKAVTRNRAQS